MVRTECPESQDAEWVARYRAGDQGAFEALVRRHECALLGFIRGMTCGKDDPDEVFQEVWYRAIRKIHLFREGNFQGWLIRIAHNIVLDRVRASRRTLSMDARPEDGSGESLETQVADRGLAPDAIVAGRDTGKRIFAAIARLPDEQREVFLLRAQQDMPFREIAVVQGVPLNTALARMHYAVGKLRLLLRDEYEADALAAAPAPAEAR